MASSDYWLLSLVIKYAQIYNFKVFFLFLQFYAFQHSPCSIKDVRQGYRHFNGFSPYFKSIPFRLSSFCRSMIIRLIFPDSIKFRRFGSPSPIFFTHWWQFPGCSACWRFFPWHKAQSKLFKFFRQLYKLRLVGIPDSHQYRAAFFRELDSCRNNSFVQRLRESFCYTQTSPVDFISGPRLVSTS